MMVFCLQQSDANIHKHLIEVFFSEKMYELNEDVARSVAGITSDANVLRLIAQIFTTVSGANSASSWLQHCDVKHPYTQFGGKRPFGVSLLCDGRDKHYGFQLYHSNRGGNYRGGKATRMGNNSAAAVSMLIQRLQRRRNDSDVSTCFSYQSPQQGHGC
uniref:Uncharacterized protein n=1 Tax=Molossus molossus TaxID=27622 RepID=A0A7J8F9F9_MOLMO|nr:hypothetical protein HJG59_008520 [Molossus molossus]